MLKVEKPMLRGPLRLIFWACVYGVLAIALLGANPFRGETVGPFDQLAYYPGWNLEREQVEVRQGERSDVLDALLPPWMESRRQIRHGGVALWDPLRSAGRPALLDPTSAQLTPGFAVFVAAPDPAFGYYLSVALTLTIAGLGMHLLVARYCGAWASIFAGFSYMACGFITAWLFWPHTHTAIWIPWLLLAVGSYVSAGSFGAFLGIAVITALMFLGGFPFVVAIGLGAALLFACLNSAGHGWRQALRRNTGTLVAIVCGLGLVAVPMLTLVAEFGGLDLSYRGGGSVLTLQAHRKLLLMPWAAEAPRVEFNMYVGILALLLAVLGLMTLFRNRRNAFVWSGFAFLLIGGILTFGILPKEIGLRLPVLSNNPWSRAILLLDIGLILLAAVGMDRLLARLRWRPAVLVVAVVLCAVQAFDLGSQFRRFNGATPAKYFFPARPELAALSATIGPFQYVAQDTRFFPFSGSLNAIGLGDWFSHALRSVHLRRLLDDLADDPFTSPTATGIRIDEYDWKGTLADAVGLCYAIFPDDAGGRKAITQTKLGPRAALPPINNVPVVQAFQMPEASRLTAIAVGLAVYGSRDLDGSVTMTVRSSSDGQEIASAMFPAGGIIDNRMTTFEFEDYPHLEAGAYEFVLLYTPGPRNKNLTAWIMPRVPGEIRRGDAPVAGALHYVVYGPQDDVFTEVAKGGGFTVARNKGCVDGAYWSADLRDPLAGRQQGTARLTAYRPDRFQVESYAKTPGFVVVPMQYHAGWEARMDGRPLQLILVRGVLPAVEVPAGKAVVVFSYRPPHWRLGLAISSASLMVLVGVWWLRRRSRRGSGPADESVSPASRKKR